MRNLMMYSTGLYKKYIKNLGKTKKNHENSGKFEKIQRLTSPSVLSYEKAQNMISKHTKNFEKSSEFSLTTFPVYIS